MLSVPGSVRILLWSEPIDMRKGFDGLAGLVRAAGEDALSGHLYVFVSRRRDRVKVLTWHRGGYVLWYKRIERGRLRLPHDVERVPQVVLDSGQLLLLIEGIDWSRVRRLPDWHRSSTIDKTPPV